MKISVRDIAKRAGVSPATVSNALNGKSGVSSANARAIIRLAQEMGYATPKENKNTESRGYVRLVQFKRHGLVIMDTQFFSEMIESIEHECRRQGLELMVTSIHIRTDADYKERIRAICAEKCAGVILLGTEMEPEDLRLFDGCCSPLVALDNLFRNEQVHAVVMNNFDAGYRATQALYAAGHRHIAHLTSNEEFSNMFFRRSGYEAAMREHGLAVDGGSFWRVTPTIEGAYADMRKLLDARGNELPTAFFAGNDIIAVGCMRAMQEKKIRIPEDVSIIGMDDMVICQISSPPLSTIRVHRKEMGAAAVRMLLHVVGDMQDSIIKSEMSVDLVQRKSIRVIGRAENEK